MEFKRFADIKRLEFIIKALKEQLPGDAEILDVGCGNGVISRAMGDRGFHVRGIDVSEKAIEKARALNTNPNVIFEVKSAEELVASGHKYHAIICSEVLEHLREPGSLLKVLYQCLSDKGVLIVTVPNGKGPREVLVTRPVIALEKKNSWSWRFVKRIKRTFGYKGTTVQSDADELTHIQFFTKKSLEKLASDNKFKITQFAKTNFIDDVFPFSLLTRKSKALQKFDGAVADKLPIALTGGFISVWQKNTH
ncbi:MAG: methyltransferase domain-containing protein [Chitinophagaceae bacterium]|nr:methyltransferase domain-containing protein [Chitinophagaceae bacterium]